MMTGREENRTEDPLLQVVQSSMDLHVKPK